MKWLPTIDAPNVTEADKELVPHLNYATAIVATGVAGDAFITVVGDITSYSTIGDSFSCPGCPVMYGSSYFYDGANTIVGIGSSLVNASFTAQTCYQYKYGRFTDSSMEAKMLHLALQNTKKQIGERFEVSRQDALGATHYFRGAGATGKHIASKVGFAGLSPTQLSPTWTPTSVPKYCIKYWEPAAPGVATYAELYIGGAVNPVVGADHSKYPDLNTGNPHSQYVKLDGVGTPVRTNYVTNMLSTAPVTADGDSPKSVTNHYVHWSAAHGMGCIPSNDAWYVAHSKTPLGTATVYGPITRYVLNMNSGTYSTVPLSLDSIRDYLIWPNVVASGYPSAIVYPIWSYSSDTITQCIYCNDSLLVGSGQSTQLTGAVNKQYFKQVTGGGLTDTAQIQGGGSGASTLSGFPQPNFSVRQACWRVGLGGTYHYWTSMDIIATLNGTLYTGTISWGDPLKIFYNDIGTTVTVKLNSVVDDSNACYITIPGNSFVGKSGNMAPILNHGYLYPLSSASIKYLLGASSAS